GGRVATEARHLQRFAARCRREVQRRSEKGRHADVADRRASEGGRSEVAGDGEVTRRCILRSPAIKALPFKGRVGWGWVGRWRVMPSRAVGKRECKPIPLPASPLKGEEHQRSPETNTGEADGMKREPHDAPLIRFAVAPESTMDPGLRRDDDQKRGAMPSYP